MIFTEAEHVSNGFSNRNDSFIPSNPAVAQLSAKSCRLNLNKRRNTLYTAHSVNGINLHTRGL